MTGPEANAAPLDADDLGGGVDGARVRRRRQFAVITAFTLAVLVALVPAASGASSGSVSQPQVTIDSSSAGATFTTLTVSFTATDGIPRETQGNSTYPGFITLSGPTGMVFPGSLGGDYGIRDGARSVLHGVAAVVDPANAGTNVVQVRPPDGFTVAPGDRVEVIARGVNNPAAPNPAARLAISTPADPAAVSSPLPIGARPPLKVAGSGCTLGLTGVSGTTRGGGSHPVVSGFVTCAATQRRAVVMGTIQRYVPSVWFGSVAPSPSLTLPAHHTVKFHLPGLGCIPGKVGHWRASVGLKLWRHGRARLVLMTSYDYVTLANCSGGL